MYPVHLNPPKLACVFEGFTLLSRKRLALPCAYVWMYFGTGNRSLRMASASCAGACSRFLKFSYSGFS